MVASRVLRGGIPLAGSLGRDLLSSTVSRWVMCWRQPCEIIRRAISSRAAYAKSRTRVLCDVTASRQVGHEVR